MRSSVVEPFLALSKHFEGDLPFLYLDRRNLVTCGIGCLVDPASLALALAWVDVASAEPVESAVVLAAWQAVKARDDLAPKGGAAFASVTTIRLTPASVDALFRERMRAADTLLAKRFACWEVSPASAQAATLSMAYAMGEGRLDEFPKFCAAFRLQDWATCALECEMDARADANLAQRNKANQQLFAACLDGTDVNTVAWP